MPRKSLLEQTESFRKSPVDAQLRRCFQSFNPNLYHRSGHATISVSLLISLLRWTSDASFSESFQPLQNAHFLIHQFCFVPPEVYIGSSATPFSIASVRKTGAVLRRHEDPTNGDWPQLWPKNVSIKKEAHMHQQNVSWLRQTTVAHTFQSRATPPSAARRSSEQCHVPLSSRQSKVER